MEMQLDNRYLCPVTWSPPDVLIFFFFFFFWNLDKSEAREPPLTWLHLGHIVPDRYGDILGQGYSNGG